MISWTWYVDCYVFEIALTFISISLLKTCPLVQFWGEKDYFSVIWWSDMYKLKIAVVINDNWHFWTLLILGIQVPPMSQKAVMLKTALTRAEEQAEFHKKSKQNFSWWCSQIIEGLYGLFPIFTTITRLISVKTEVESSAEKWIYYSKINDYTKVWLCITKSMYDLSIPRKQTTSETFALIFKFKINI